jgi:uncharacterized protein YpuA (DUF1002 family)
MNQRIFLEDVKKLRKTKIKDVDWEKIRKYIENDDEYGEWSDLLRKMSKNRLLKTLLEKMGDNYFSIMDLLIINIMKDLNITTLRGQIFIKYL